MPAKLVRRYKRKKKHRKGEDGGSPRHNPPMFQDLAEFIGPGFAGFAAARLTTRIAATQIAKRKPSWGKHAGAAAALAAFLAAWLLAHKWKALAKYHTPIVVGAGIAALQSLIQLYIPKLGWMVADASPEIEATGAAAQLPDHVAGQLPDNLTPTDEDPADYIYNDSYDAGRMANDQPAPQQQAQAPAAQSGDDEYDVDLDDSVFA